MKNNNKIDGRLDGRGNGKVEVKYLSGTVDKKIKKLLQNAFNKNIPIDAEKLNKLYEEKSKLLLSK